MESQKEDRMVRSNLAFPPLNWTFRSRAYINSTMCGEDKDMVTPLLTLTINVITKKEEIVQNVCPTVYLCPSDFELSNWSIVEILIV